MSRRKQKKNPGAVATEPGASLAAPSRHPSKAESQDASAELLTALALGGIAILRPWKDGMAFPAVNDYYLWVQAALFALVAARMLVRREALRFPLLVTLLAAYLGIAILATLGTAQYNNSYRALLVWTGHFFLFAVAAQTLRNPRSFAIVLSGFVAGAFAEALFSVLHLKYYIPLVREQVRLNPGLVQRYFSAAELNPEIARRLNSNRAFGTFLFPNALAGYMVLGVPLAIGASVYSIQTVCRLLNQETKAARHAATPGEATAAALGSWALTALITYTAFSFFHAVAYRDQPLLAHWLQLGFWAGMLPVAVGILIYMVTRRHGLLVCWWTVASCVSPAFGLAAMVALFYSFSRGGLLAFLISTAITGAMLFVLLRKPHLIPPKWASVALLALVCCALIPAFGVPAAAAPSAELVPEGVAMSVEELANPATMLLRTSYWRTGLSMIAAHFWTGVGPGNFGVMYPQYKYVGAGETKHAHNDYLQVFAETGVCGALAFCAFWAVCVLTAFYRLVQMRKSPRLWLVAGLFASVLAFLLHAAVDFDFVNPSLASMAFLLAGVLCAATAIPGSEERESRYARPLAAVFLACVAVAVGASFRVHRADALAGSETEFRTRLLAAQFFVFQAPQQYEKDRRSVNIPIQDALALIPNIEALKQCGAFWVVEPGKSPRKLGAYEPLSPNVYLNVTSPDRARETALRAAENTLVLLEEADSMFPHDPIRAVQLSTWCDFLSEAAGDGTERLEWSNRAVEWAREALDRSPHEAWFHEQYAAALSSRAQVDPDPAKRLDGLFRSLEHYEQSAVLFPSSPVVWENYARALGDLGEILKQSGETGKGEAMRQKADEMAVRAHEIRTAEYRANRRRAGLE